MKKIKKLGLINYYWNYFKNSKAHLNWINRNKIKNNFEKRIKTFVNSQKYIKNILVQELNDDVPIENDSLDLSFVFRLINQQAETFFSLQPNISLFLSPKKNNNLNI